jgi:hypothetical protein
VQVRWSQLNAETTNVAHALSDSTFDILCASARKPLAPGKLTSWDAKRVGLIFSSPPFGRRHRHR